VNLPTVIRTREELAKWRAKAIGTIGFVPTMGALHAGHTFLAKQAKKNHDFTVVSIFVNPKQFAEGEDLESYPKDLDTDLKAVAGIADVVFAPTKGVIYKPGFDTHITAGKIAGELCGKYRPPHFDGVVTVVYLLLQLVKPHCLYLGKKDYQQLSVVKRMVRDLMLDIEVTGVETQRNEGGLALSSRNRYLTPEQLKEATHIRRCLTELQARDLSDVDDMKTVAEKLFVDLGATPNLKPQYAEIRLRKDLSRAKEPKPGQMVALVAVFLGKARLIDNIEI